MADNLAGIGRFNVIDPAFTKVAPSAETLRIAGLNAAPGQTAEQYLASRGGVNASGYYGDSWSAKTNLSDAQYAAAKAGKTGVAAGSAINAATAKLIYDNVIASIPPKGDTESDTAYQARVNTAKTKAAGDYNSAVAGSNAANKQNIPLMTDDNGNVIASTSSGGMASSGSGDSSLAAATRYASDQATAIEKARIQGERVSAYALLESEFTKYGLGELAGTVKQLILDGASSAEMTIKLRNTPQYQIRFAGNIQRLKEGKNVYDEATYLALENSMQQAFTAYGVSNLLGDTRAKQQAKLSTFIGGDISPTEVKNRIQLAVDEVTNRPDILSAFQTYYPQVTSTDLVSYFLDPKETTTRLTTKIKASQIGAAAMRQGFVSNVLNSEELAALGVTEEQAVLGYKNVAAVLPEAEKLSAIENTSYSASEAEGAYLRNLESEQRKLRKLAERETARFGGRSGVNQTSLKEAKGGGQF
jgi:ribosomal protein S11